MKIALVASSYLPQPGSLERRLDALAQGLQVRGAEVDVVIQAPRPHRVARRAGVTVHQVSMVDGPLRLGAARGLWQRVRLYRDQVDVIDVHTRDPRSLLMVTGSRAGNLVFSPHGPIDRFAGWPYERVVGAFTATAARIVCRSAVARERLCHIYPRAAARTRVIPFGIDSRAIEAAEPFESARSTVLAVGRLEDKSCLARVIAAMAGLDPALRLVIVGDGPAHARLTAYAAYLRLASRVQFVGSVCDELFYRWLRTAQVVVTIPNCDRSGMVIAQALAAGACVVASDVPVHREVTARCGDFRVVYVSPEGSPLDLADAIAEAACGPAPLVPGLNPDMPYSWEGIVDTTWRMYEELRPGAGVRPDDRGRVLMPHGRATHRDQPGRVADA